ncbi:hypothetical protein BS78_03G207800 [Paspalum vaginatum]|nr:hypothetical protein BS78_03G207800 [Paspalum vaginatum]
MVHSCCDKNTTALIYQLKTIVLLDCLTPCRRSLVRVASVPVLDHFAIRSLSSTSLSCSSARQAARSSTTPTFSRATTASSALTSSRSSASHSSSCRSYSPSVSTTAMTTTTHARPARMTGPAWGRD